MIRERRMPFGALSDRPPPHRTRAQESVRPRGRSGNIVDPPGGRGRPPRWLRPVTQPPGLRFMGAREELMVVGRASVPMGET